MITVNDILNICKGELVCGDKDLECKIFTKDTRSINDGDIYIGIKGEVYDGNTFYREAFDKGAKACILDNKEVIKDTHDGDTFGMIPVETLPLSMR